MLAALVLATACTAPPAVTLRAPAVPPAQMQVVLDPQRRHTLEALSVQPGCGQFAPLGGDTNFGAVGGGAWLRFRAELPGRVEDWRLVMRFAGLDAICAHWPLRGELTRSDCRRRGEPGWDGQRHVFEVPVDYDSRRPIVLHGESAFWLKLPVELTTGPALLAAESASRFRGGLYYGVLAAFVLISLASWVGGRDRAFLTFALMMGALTAALALWQGQFAALDPAGFSLTRLGPVFLSLFFALGAAFYQRYFDTRQHLPGAHRLLAACVWGAVALAAVQLPLPILATWLLALLAFAWVGAALWTSIARARQGFRPAWAVLAAVSLLLASIILNALTVAGIDLMPGDGAIRLAHAGTLLASGFLVFGLLWRVRGLTEERNKAAELAQANQQLALRRARYDELTGLPNRGKFREDVQERMIHALAGGQKLALVTIGLDKFRAINHAIGHEGGDQVLIEIAMRLRQAMQQDDLLARLGADTFGWLTTIQGTEVAEFKNRCAQLRKTLSSPLLSGRGATLSASMGAAVFPLHASSAEPLLRASDEAFYRAKELGGNTLDVFDPGLRRNAQLHMQLSKDLRSALIRDELELYYQPLVSMDARGELVGVEALLRWQRQGQFVPPDQVIPIAESTDLIVPLTEWVFRRACRQWVDWQRRAVAVPSISVNISPYQFRLPGFAERIDAVLKEFGMPGEAVVLEITESALLDDMAATRETLLRLRERGVRVAVDDFGVGYSSLSYLRTLPVQSVKIDRSFLQGVPAEAEAVSVINAIIALGRDLGLKVTAEGIETNEQHFFLAQRGTDVGQGFLIAKALPPAALETWLAARRGPQVAAA